MRSSGWFVAVLLLSCSGKTTLSDAGALADSGVDAGTDAGFDAGFDAGVDSGVVDMGPIEVQVLGINDFHGALEAIAVDGGTRGGAALLAGRVKALRRPNSIFVSAGDLIGGSPLSSGYFHDEPTIEVMNAMGLELAGVGNHEFDEGAAELLRMQNGGCHPKDGCQASATFPGATFHFLGANVVVKATGALLLPSSEVRELGGVKLGFIGLTLEGTPSQTDASRVTDLEFKNDVATVNALVPGLKAQGAKAVVVMLHDGSGSLGSPDQCFNISPGFEAQITALDPSVVAVFSGHSHAAYNCSIAGKTVTMAGSRGAFLTDLRLFFSRQHELLSVQAVNVETFSDVAPDPAVEAIVNRVSGLSAPLGGRVVGTITASLTTAGSTGGDSAMGNVIADAMLESAAGPPASAVVALMNAGGIRGSLLFAKSGAETADGQVTYAEAATVQPFGNSLSTVTITGAELREILEASVSGLNKQVQVAGLTFTWNLGAPPGQRVAAANVMIGNSALQLAASYRVVTNSILSTAASGYASLARRDGETGGGVDLDALLAYFAAHPALSPPAQRVFVQ